MMVFRYWDQNRLDIELNARATVPDIGPFIRAYADESARMRKELSCQIGVKYGPSADERMDIFLPHKGRAPAPIFVFIHGGYWRLLDAADSSFMAHTFVERGACVIALNYGLAPQTSLEEIVRQCRAGLSYIWHHAEEFGGDRHFIHVCGSSAGGHLTGMMLAPDWHDKFNVPDNCVHSASPLSGLFDLEPVRLSHVNEWIGLDASVVQALSPLRHLPRRAVPLVVSYGESETFEFQRQSEVYAAACAARGCDVRLVMEDKSNHFDLPLRLMNPQSALTQAIWDVMGLA
jgi:arylformamidase